MTHESPVLAMYLALVACGCSDTAGIDARGGAGADGGTGAAPFESGTPLGVMVPEAGRAYVSLSNASVVAPEDAKSSLGWDLAFEGFDVFTNSGVSGPGDGAAFGPLDAPEFARDIAPTVPFVTQDKTGGAFLDWYAYDGASHALYSRYHVFGVKDGARLWKVQILGYYGERDGATIPALYQLRYAELEPTRPGATRELGNVDGTAGGASAPATAASECVDLGTGARTMFTPADARQSDAWHLCFRRASITVNGEMGGPRGVGAVDLGADDIGAETLDAVKTRTREGMMPAFADITRVSFDKKTFRGDHVVSAFGERWLAREEPSPKPAEVAWLVRDAAGKQKFLVAFTSFEMPSSRSPTTVRMRIKPVKG